MISFTLATGRCHVVELRLCLNSIAHHRPLLDSLELLMESFILLAVHHGPSLLSSRVQSFLSSLHAFLGRLDSPHFKGGNGCDLKCSRPGLQHACSSSKYKAALVHQHVYKLPLYVCSTNQLAASQTAANCAVDCSSAEGVLVCCNTLEF